MINIIECQGVFFTLSSSAGDPTRTASQVGRHYHLKIRRKLIVPWSQEHKQKTRDRIIDSAATVFRECGLEQSSVAAIMQRAGLTHGGFYAHFDSKDELVAEAISHACAQVSGLFATTPADASRRTVLDVAAKYLSPAHFAHPERGCPIAALGGELTRSGQPVRRILSNEIRERLAKLYEWTTARLSPDTRRRQAAGAMACMVGGLILARSLKESEGLEFLQDCQGFLRDVLSPPNQDTEGSDRR